ncbi:MAG: hypothetical protein D6739_12690 [Nitrospirae bacterium]|nr:MAG: hypothetical protein D6739_12690 [Nitrospirota bacterium]
MDGIPATRGERGGGRLGSLLLLALFAAGGYTGWAMLQPWLRFWHFRADAEATVRLAQVLGRDTLHQRLLKAAEEAGVLLDHPEEAIHLVYGNGHARVEASWSDAAEFPFGYEYWFDFHFDVEG